MKDHQRTPVKRVGRKWFECWKLKSYRGRCSNLRVGPAFYFVETSKARANRIARNVLNAQFQHLAPIAAGPSGPLIKHRDDGTVTVFRENAL